MFRSTAQFFCILWLFCVSVNQAVASESATIYTTPISLVMTDDPERPGIGYEIVKALFDRIGKPFEIISLPWARAQYMAENTPEALIFPLSRTPTRENKFTWGVNIFNNETHFITFNGTKMSAEEARDKHIGVHLKSSWDNWLTEQGYEKVYRVPGEGGELIRLLRNNRIDAWYTDTIIAGGVLAGLEDEGITYSDPIQIFETFLASNAETPYRYLSDLQAAMTELRQSGVIDKIFKKYGVPPNY